MKQILVTGATSQIGKYLLPLLVENGYSVIALSRSNHKNEPGIKWEKCDIETSDLLSISNLDIGVIIHLAEITLATKTIKSFKNVRNVIAFSSTSAETKVNSHNEKDKKLALTLIEGESNFIHFCDNSFIKWVIFRPTLIYGASMDKNISFIIKFICKYSFFPILGRGKGLRQPVHAYDLAQACIKSIENNQNNNQIYNLAGGETLSYKSMVEKIFISLNKKPRIIKIPKNLFVIIVSIIRIQPKYNHLTTGMVDRLDQDLCFDISKAKKDFGYNPHRFLELIDGI